MDSEQQDREWALRRLLDFAEHLTSHGPEIAQLRAAKVNDQRIINLYPFAFSDFANGTYRLTDANWRIIGGFEPEVNSEQRNRATDLLASNYEALTNPARFFVDKSELLTQAISHAEVSEHERPAPFLLEVVLATLDQLVSRGILNLSLINPITGEVFPLRKIGRWNRILGAFILVVDQLCQILEPELATA